MKADVCGTVTEQHRHSVGWRDGEGVYRCRFCRFCSSYRAGGKGLRHRCTLNNFSTRALARCDKYERKQTLLSPQDRREMQDLQRELADDIARADIESFGEIIPGPGKDNLEQFRNCWYLRPGRDEGETRDFDRGVRYLELRGLLERHPENPDLVRPKEEETK